jgi:hypothetical protein
MIRMMARLSIVALAAFGLGVSPAHAADVKVGVNIGVPAPPVIVLPAPPQLVVVPGTPVYYAPGLSLNFFAYGGRYYTLHDGAWFVAKSHAGPWAFVPVERVPRPVLGVPATYYKVPPGHSKGRAGPPGHAKGPKH